MALDDQYDDDMSYDDHGHRRSSNETRGTFSSVDVDNSNNNNPNAMPASQTTAGAVRHQQLQSRHSSGTNGTMGTMGASQWSIDNPGRSVAAVTGGGGANTANTTNTAKAVSNMENMDLHGRYDPGSLRHLDVEATLATLGEADDDDDNGTYSYVGGSYGGTGGGGGEEDVIYSSGPYGGPGPTSPSMTTYESRRRRKRWGLTTLLFLGAAGVTAVAVMATFGIIELEELYAWVRGPSGGEDGGASGSLADFVISTENGSSTSSSTTTTTSTSSGQPKQEDIVYFSKKHMLLDRTDDCRDVAALHSHDGWDRCEKACIAASCCHEPPGDALSCVNKRSRSLCEEYTELCGRLHTIVEPPAGKETIYVPPAPSNIDSICSEDSLATAAGLMVCEEACHHSRCCKYQPTDGHRTNNIQLRNCKEDNLETCAMYDRPCHAFPGFDVSTEYDQAMESVKDALNLDELSPEAEEAPIEPAATNGASLDNNGVIPGLERRGEIVADLCSSKSLQEHIGRESCKEVCNSHLCCFAGAGYGMENINVCPSGLAEECTAYLPCRTAYLSGIGNGEVNPVDPEDAFDNRADIVQAVVDACKSVEGSEGKHKCHTTCDAHMCCFLRDDSECPAKEGEACDVFEPCKVLLS